MADTERFVVIHALKVKGLATADDLAAITGRDDLAPILTELADELLVRERTGRVAGFALTKEGRAAHPDLVAGAVTDEERTAVGQSYEAFLPVNGRFKDACTRWQTRGGEPNDHADPAYDEGVVAELGAIHDDVVAALAPAAAASGRFARYPSRFESALSRVRGGDVSAFARPMSHSYHDVWMELHEDMLLTLGRERDKSDGH